MPETTLTKQAAEAMEFPLIYGGAKHQTEGRMEVINPATEEVIGYSAVASEADVAAAIAAADQAFQSWRNSSDEERQDVCNKIAAIIEKHADELAVLVSRESGKPIEGFGARFEVGAAVAWTATTAALSLEDRVISDTDEGKTVLRHEPIGVCGSITPWNWPLMIAAWHIIPALRTGNTIVIKPSEKTPLSTYRLVELINEVAPGLVNIVTGGGDVGAMLSSHPAIGKMVFTGSTNTGRHVMRACSENFKRVTLELGGNDAGIVLPGTDIAPLVEPMFWGAFMHSGQVCLALKRLYVHEADYDAVCAALVEFNKTVPMGDPLDEETRLGPLQNPEQLKIVETMVDEAIAAGGRALSGGKRAEGKGFFYPISFIADAVDGMRLVDEEQFGPALPIIRYKNVEDAIAAANNLEFGLGASVWGQDREQAMAVANQLEAGTVFINKHADISPDTPFGGIKNSGLGVEFGVEGLAAYTNIKVYSMAN
jgi:acyl-CoA reductase-like NAD-dependent aldehyde dehydrogenase